MRPDVYMNELRRQLATRWLCGTSASIEVGENEHVTISWYALVSRMRHLFLQCGGIRSLATIGHTLPASGATLMDVVSVAFKHHTQRERAAAPSTSVTLWAPDAEECSAALCARLPASKLLLPREDTVSAELLRSLFEWFPDELRVRPTDSRESLLQRIACSPFLDDIDAPISSKNQKARCSGQVECDMHAATEAGYLLCAGCTSSLPPSKVWCCCAGRHLVPLLRLQACPSYACSSV